MVDGKVRGAPRDNPPVPWAIDRGEYVRIAVTWAPPPTEEVEEDRDGGSMDAEVGRGGRKESFGLKGWRWPQ